MPDEVRPYHRVSIIRTHSLMFLFVDISKPQDVLFSPAHLEPLMRFIELIINPLKAIYSIPATSIHVFYNLEGPTIAFNRGGALFMNLRYYEGWRKFS